MRTPEIVMALKASNALGEAHGEIYLARKVLQEAEQALRFIHLRDQAEQDLCNQIAKSLGEMIDDLGVYNSQVSTLAMGLEEE